MPGTGRLINNDRCGTSASMIRRHDERHRDNTSTTRDTTSSTPTPRAPHRPTPRSPATSPSCSCRTSRNTALAAADTAFTALTTGPVPLCINCDALAPDTDTGLPAGIVPLRDLRDWMLTHPHAYPARDAVWAELVRRARTGDPVWVVATVGMAIPALIHAAGQLSAGYRGDPADVDAEILTGFLTALRRADPDTGAVYAGLVRAGWRAGYAARHADHAYLPVCDLEHTAGRRPAWPYGHPDLLVARAAALGVIDPDDAEAFIEIRLAHRNPAPVAARLGITTAALRMRLTRAGHRLATAVCPRQPT